MLGQSDGALEVVPLATVGREVCFEDRLLPGGEASRVREVCSRRSGVPECCPSVPFHGQMRRICMSKEVWPTCSSGVTCDPTRLG